MMKYKLLESIGSVDETLLQECETLPVARKRTGLRILLVAAIVALLSITAVAARNYFSYQPVSGGEIVPATFKITITDTEWNVVEIIGDLPGYCVEADIKTFPDVPMKLLYPYLPDVPDHWKSNGAGHAKYDGEIGMVGIAWNYEKDGAEYEVFYRQESAYFYNTRHDPAVWWLDHLPKDVTVSGRTTTIGDAPVYRVEVSGSKDRNFYTYDRSLIFWSDGYSIFQLDVPQHWEEARIYELMCSLTLQEDIAVALGNLN